MKTLEWLTFFAQQRTLHGKVIFSVAELANAAQTSLHAVNTELGRLLRRGVIARYAHGRYGPTQGVAPEDLLPALDPGAYLTGFYALFRQHLVSQAPTEVTCFTSRRHNRRPDRLTPAGRLRFLRVPGAVYAKPRQGTLAPAEQALCDFVWLNLRDGLAPQSLVTFRNLHTLNCRRLNHTLRHYPENVRDAVCRIISAPQTECRSREGTSWRWSG
jgi:hypothetical protein